LVDSSERRNIDGLSSDGTTGSNTGGVFSGTRLNDGLEEDLERVLVGEQVDDLKSLLEDADSHLLLTVHTGHTTHELADKSLENWAGDLCKSLLLILTGSVRMEHLSFISSDVEVLVESGLRAFHIFI